MCIPVVEPARIAHHPKMDFIKGGVTIFHTEKQVTSLRRHCGIKMYLSTLGLLKTKQRVCSPDDQPSICDRRGSQHTFAQFDFMSRFGIVTLVFND